MALDSLTMNDLETDECSTSTFLSRPKTSTSPAIKRRASSIYTGVSADVEGRGGTESIQ